MLSKNKIKLIRSLDLKKNRSEKGLFLAEGKKIVFDLLGSGLKPIEIFCTNEIAEKFPKKDNSLISITAENELKKISSLKSTPDIIALFLIPETTFNWEELSGKLSLVLDAIQDPGNLGTIIRTADWFGIKNIICSEDTADLYNLKTVQSTMGAIARVKVHYLPLKKFLTEAKDHHIPIYGTFMEGDNIYKTDLSANGIVIMGNEGKGISKETEAFTDKKISIPNYSDSQNRSESLNVAIAASIICSEFRRRAYK
jgi:TrmH family RNA methyltransferase